MSVVPGSDIKVFVHFDQLRDEFFHRSNPEVQCAYFIKSDHRCAERVTLQAASLALAKRFIESSDRTSADARKMRRFFLCQQHIKDTYRSFGDGFFIRAGWCSRREVSSKTDTTNTNAVTSSLPKKNRNRKVVTLNLPGDRLAQLSTTNSAEVFPTMSGAEASDIRSPRTREKRHLESHQEIPSSKRHKPLEKATNMRADEAPRIPFSSTKLSTLTPGSHTDARRMRPCKRSIDRTPSFAETYKAIFNQDRHECLGLASKTLQRCRRPITVERLKDQLRRTPTVLTQEYLWNMLHFLLCEKHVSEQQRYIILQRWSLELGLCEDNRAESPEPALPTPATSPIPPSPRSRPEEVDLTAESDIEMGNPQTAQARNDVSRTTSAPPQVVDEPSIREHFSSEPAPPLSSAFPSKPKDVEQRSIRPKPTVSRRGRPRVHSPEPQTREKNASEHVTARSEEEAAPVVTSNEHARDSQVDAHTTTAEQPVGEPNPDESSARTTEAAADNLDLENSDMPTLSVNDAEPDLFPASMPWEAYQAVKDEMLKPIDQEGFVYVIRSRSRPGLVKVGKAVDIHERMKEIQKTCKLDDLELVRDPRQTKIYHVAKLERLVHKELKIVQKADFKCNNPDHAPKGVSHREWFEIDGSEAVNVVQRWRKWLKSKPYGDVRIQNLSEKWVHTIENHFPEPEEEEQDVHDHDRRNQKFDDFVNLGLGMQ